MQEYDGQVKKLIQELEKVLIQDETRKEWIFTWKAKRDKLHKSKRLNHKAEIVVKKVAEGMQGDIKRILGKLVSGALIDVFGKDDAYNLVIDFVYDKRSTKVECWLEKDGEFLDPMDSNGYGVVDVACMALRAVLIGLQKEHRKVLLLDEPFKHVSEDLMPRVAAFLKKICSDLELQLIMVTNRTDLATCADKVFKVTQTDKVSGVREIKL